MLLVGLSVVGLALGGAAWLTGRDSWVSTSSIRSALLGRDMPIEIFSPPSIAACPADGRTLLIVFHGRGADQTQWFGGRFGTGARLDAVAHRLIESGELRPLVIVSAFIDASYGVDSEPRQDGYTHGPYERFILDELVPELESRLGVGGTAQTRAVAGISMGGFVALSLGLRTQMFGHVAGVSPAIFVNPPRSRSWIYGADRSRDPVSLALVAPLTPKSFLIGYGDRDYDWIRRGSVELSSRLRDRGANVVTQVVPGGHDSTTTRQLAEPMLRALFPTRPVRGC